MKMKWSQGSDLSLSGFHLGVSTCGMPLVVVICCCSIAFYGNCWLTIGCCSAIASFSTAHFLSTAANPKTLPLRWASRARRAPSRATAKRIKLKAHLGNTAMARLEAALLLRQQAATKSREAQVTFWVAIGEVPTAWNALQVGFVRKLGLVGSLGKRGGNVSNCSKMSAVIGDACHTAPKVHL